MVQSTDEALPFDELVAQHGPRVRRHARRLTGNRADAEDLTQEVLLRAFRTYRQAAPRDVAAWLHRVTLNLHLDHQRARASRPDARPASDLLAGAGRDVASAAPGPEQQVVDRGMAADVESALAGLSPESRQAVLLRDLGGLSYLEVAQALGVGTDTVRSWIHRGRRRLRDALAHRAPVGPGPAAGSARTG